jgi:hypothetical protein
MSLIDESVVQNLLSGDSSCVVSNPFCMHWSGCDTGELDVESSDVETESGVCGISLGSI